MLKIIASFVLGFLFVRHALGDFTAHADHKGKEGLLMTGKHSVLPDEKELIDEISKIAGSRIIGIGGRKMAAQKVVLRNGELTPTTTSSKNSGKDSNKASKYNFNGRPQTKLNQKGGIKILKTAASSTSSNIGIPRDEPTKHSQVDEETRRLLEAEREIVNLMHKDYKGSSGGSMGRRKPPIHNQEPQH
ncbi:uncharacterized protein LOC133745219 [Rosa rugosa]|uniref:uncharacterized protein LOC133745219 n=1 Tax=Rosa rugosa TaxID=74645 RepID=UPI002B400F5C|nr:uncharacterized protein LOC133745219 [Rosa rugosa]